MSRHASPRGGFLFHALRFFEIARVLVCFDHVARCIVNANHGVVRAAELLCISDCVYRGVRSVIPEPTERQRIGNQIDTAFVFARSDFINVRFSRRLHGR